MRTGCGAPALLQKLRRRESRSRMLDVSERRIGRSRSSDRSVPAGVMPPSIPSCSGGSGGVAIYGFRLTSVWQYRVNPRL